MTGRRLFLGLALGALSVLGACKKDREPQPQGEGVAVDTGPADDLRRAPDGRHVAYLLNGQKPGGEGISPKVQLGALHVASVEGGPGRMVARDVTNLPGGFSFSPDGRWIHALAGYDLPSRSGMGIVLSLEDPIAERIELGASVSDITISRDGRLIAFVDGGVLKLGPLPSGPFREIGGEVINSEFTPDGSALFFKRRLSAGGGLMVVATAGEAAPKRLADQVGDFRIAPDGKRVAFAARSPESRDIYDLHVAAFPSLEPSRVAVGVTDFRFSPDGSQLARLEGFALGVEPELYVGPSDGAGGRRLGKAVGTYTFAPDSRHLAYLDSFSSSASAGVLHVVELPEGAPKRLGVRVPNFDWAPDGSAIAFVERVFDPVYSVSLSIYEMGAEGPKHAGSGVYGYGFAPNSRHVFFRNACQREGRSCRLMRYAVPTDETQKVADAIYTYEVSEDAERVLVTHWPIKLRTQNVAVVRADGTGHRVLDEGALLPAYLVGNGQLAAYALGGDRSGVYLAPAEPGVEPAPAPGS